MSNHSGDTNKMVGEDHIRDATKMVSDTPMTDSELVEMITGDGPVKTITKWVHSSVCFQLERKLKAANDRIQSLIEERDRANQLADWKWNLRGEFESLLGTDNIEKGIKAVKKMKQRIKRLEGELESTKADRDSWSNQSDEFAKTAADLIIHIKRLEEAGDEMATWLSDPRNLGDDPFMSSQWRKAKEAKP